MKMSNNNKTIKIYVLKFYLFLSTDFSHHPFFSFSLYLYPSVLVFSFRSINQECEHLINTNIIMKKEFEIAYSASFYSYMDILLSVMKMLPVEVRIQVLSWLSVYFM